MSTSFEVPVKGFTPAECTDLDRWLGRGPTRGRVGLALSGGGTRATICALGALRALHAWGLLKHVRAISAVSGAAWATVPYTFLPPTFDEDAFLGTYIDDPGALKGGPRAGAGRIDRIEPTDGLYPYSAAAMNSITFVIKTLAGKPMGIDSHRLWNRIITDGVLAPWGLGGFDSLHRPTSFFAADAAEVQGLRAACPSLPSVAHVVRPDASRPLLMVNAALRVTGDDGEPTMVPICITPHFSGVIGRDGSTLDDRPVGRGAVQSAGFGGVWQDGPAEAPVVGRAHPLSLGEVVGMASSFFADALADRGVDLINPLIRYFAPDWTPPTGTRAQAIDAGSLECTGVAQLLAMDGIDAVIAAINPPTRAGVVGGDMVVDRQVAALFGYQVHDPQRGWLRYGEPGPGDPDYAHSQVFAADEFGPLLDAFAERHRAGDALVVARTHTVVDNPRFAVRGGRKVRVVWSVLAAAPQWTRALRPPTRLARGPSFPNLPTALTAFPAPTVNLLAHYVGWMLGRQRGAIEALFAAG